MNKARFGGQERESLLHCNNYHFYRPTGITFVVPASDVLVSTPEIGEIASFSYERHTREDTPESPKIFRIRTDVSWGEVVNNARKEKQYLNGKIIPH